MVELDEYIQRVKELNPSITVRQALRSDGDNFVNLFNTYFKRKTTLTYFHWQFFDSPYESAMFTAYDGEKLAGYYGVKLYPLSNGMITGFAIDFLTDEPYRRRGIAFLLEAEVVRFCKERSVSLLSALPNSHGNAAFKSLGWKSIGKIDSLVLDPMNANRLDAFEPDAENSCRIEFVKTDTYCHWRFNSNPVYKYEKFSAKDGAFAMVKLFKDPVTGVTVGDIVDYKYGPDFDSLFEKIVSGMKEKNVAAITTWALPQTPLNSLFTCSGFKTMPQERYFCVKLFVPEQMLIKINNWSLVQADAEIY